MKKNSTQIPFARKLYDRNIAIIVFLLAWEILPRIGFINSTFIPPFSKIFCYLVHSLYIGDLQPHIFKSLSRSATGFTIALLVATPLGFVLGWFKEFERYIDPLIQVFRQTSAFAHESQFRNQLKKGFVNDK